MYNLNNLSTSITDRAVNAAWLPYDIAKTGLQGAGHTVIGVAGTALSVLTLGTVPAINKLANRTGHSCSLSSRIIYTPIMKVINPKAKICHNDNYGYFTKRIANPIFKAAINSAKSKNKFSKHVESRLAFMAGPLVATATRTMDFALGIFAFALSIITLGTHTEINNFALKNLAISAVIYDVCSGFRGFVNPQQFAHIGK